MAEEKKEERKIIIDEDWKGKAQKEKEVLKEKGKIETPKKDAEQQYQLPAGDFGALVSLLATQAMFAMGIITTEKDKEPKKNLKLAKFHIDILESLEAKTKGNLTDEEQKFLSGTLSQLRMGFVRAAE
ncbi:MAG: DUF1844 domain-containing protein [Sedimentisphaerales bacterium]